MRWAGAPAQRDGRMTMLGHEGSGTMGGHAQPSVEARRASCSAWIVAAVAIAAAL